MSEIIGSSYVTIQRLETNMAFNHGHCQLMMIHWPEKKNETLAKTLNIKHNPIIIGRKVSKYRIFSGPYFPAFGLTREKYEPEKTPHLETFHAVNIFWKKRNVKWKTKCIGTKFTCVVTNQLISLQSASKSASCVITRTIPVFVSFNHMDPLEVQKIWINLFNYSFSYFPQRFL